MSATAEVVAIVAAHNETERIADTLGALANAFPNARIWLADDGSTDDTAAIAERVGATVVRGEHVIGKGGAVTRAACAALQRLLPPPLAQRVCVAPGSDGGDRMESEPVVVLCDGDLGESAALLGALVESVQRGEADMAVALFARSVGGGFGVAVRFAQWAIRRRCGFASRAPISGQRAVRASVLAEMLPLASGFGMEIGMTIDAVRSGHRVVELELDLSHRATGRTIGGFVHRGRQLIDFLRVYRLRG